MSKDYRGFTKNDSEFSYVTFSPHQLGFEHLVLIIGVVSFGIVVIGYFV